MSTSSSSQSGNGQAEASTSRAQQFQPSVENAHSDDDALLSSDPLEGRLPEQYDVTDRVMLPSLTV